MKTIDHQGHRILAATAAIAATLCGCTSYQLASLDLDAGVAQPTLVVPTVQTEGLRAVVWASRPTERLRRGYLSRSGRRDGPTPANIDTANGQLYYKDNPNAYYEGSPKNTRWHLPDFQTGVYLEAQLPLLSFVGLGGHLSIRENVPFGLLEGRLGVEHRGIDLAMRGSIGGFIGVLKADAVHVIEHRRFAQEGDGRSYEVFETLGRKATNGFLVDIVVGGLPSREHVVSVFAFTYVRQNLFTHSIMSEGSNSATDLDEIVNLYSFTPGINIPISNRSSVTVAIRCISDISLDYTRPSAFFLPLVQWNVEF